MLAVEVIDPRELELPDVGVLELIDTETGRRIEVQTASVKLRQRYAEAAAEQRAATTRALRGVGAEHMVLRTDRDWLLDIVHYVGNRRRTASHGPRGDSMSFLAGWRLILLLVVVALLAAYVVDPAPAPASTSCGSPMSTCSRRSRRSARAGGATSPPRCSCSRWRCSVVAFARPTRPTQVPREQATVMLAFDVSQSMEAEDIKPTRLEAAQLAAIRFADILPKKFKLGLVTFAGNASVVVPPVTNRARVKAAVRNVELQQRTAIGEAIFASLDAIETIRIDGTERKVPATIVVMSDGFTNAGRPNADAAQAAVKAKVPVSTISFGTQDGTVVVQGREVGVPASPEALEEIADSTGGRFSEATTGEELQQAYEGLNSSIGYREVQRDVTEWFVGIALAFAFLAAGASLLWTSRLL